MPHQNEVKRISGPNVDQVLRWFAKSALHAKGGPYVRRENFSATDPANARGVVTRGDTRGQFLPKNS